MSDNQKKTFEWYVNLVELGRFEVQHGKSWFFNTAKLHLIIVAGMLALASYGIANNSLPILYLAILVAFFGIMNAFAWWRQIESQSPWKSRWYLSAANLEEHEDFRKIVGADSVKAWSHEEVKSSLIDKNQGASQSLYKFFVGSVIIFYLVFGLGACFYQNNIMGKKNTVASSPELKIGE